MKKGKISYVEEDKHRLRVKNFRFVGAFLTGRLRDFNTRFVKNIKFLRKFRIFDSKLIPKLGQTFKTIKRMHLASFGSKEAFLIKRCKNITWFTHALETERSLLKIQTLTRLKILAFLTYPRCNDHSKNLESLLERNHFEILHFSVKSTGAEGSLKALNFENTSSLGISLNDETAAIDFNLLPNPEVFRKIKSVKITLDEDDGCPQKDIRSFLKNVASNIQILDIAALRSPLKELSPIEDGVIKNMSDLRDFHYCGKIFGSPFASLNCNMFPKESLRMLRLVLLDENLDSYLLGRFVRQIKQLVNLEDLRLHFNCLVYADQIVHDLPCNLPSIKSVNLQFGHFNDSIKGDIELRLHLNAFLDWIVSLPNLEKVYLAHPSINYCYCSYLEDYKVSPKLREVQIIETEQIYDLGLLEVEYLEHDLTTILKILSTESLQRFIFSVHLESFKQNMVDVVVQNMMKCVNLRDLRLTFWFNMLGEKTANKIISLFSSLYFVKKRDFVVQYCQAEQKENFSSKDLRGSGDMKWKLNFKQFENKKIELN